MANPSNIPFSLIPQVGSNLYQITNIDIPYWKDTFQTWNLYYNKTYQPDLNNIQYILFEPIWCNSHFLNATLYIKNWKDKGISQIKDLCDFNGIMTFHKLKSIYDIRGTFLD